MSKVAFPIGSIHESEKVGGGILKLCQLLIKNFRGIQEASLLFPDHAVLISDNNVGKTTVLEAIDLVLGPDRLNRRPPVDEHDFHLGKYLPSKKKSTESKALE